ncbi:MAG: efflux RND transporter periplasmic adaptor subunit [Pseudomonadota bacterium]
MRDLVDNDLDLGVAPGSTPGSAPGALLTQRPAPRRRRASSLLFWTLAGSLAAAALIGGVRYGLPVPATPHVVATAPFDVTLNGPGTLEARRHAKLSTTVQGRIDALPYDVGDDVQAAAPIARLEDAEARHDLAQARQQARATEHTIREAEAQRQREEAALRHADRELARQTALRGRGVIAEGALDAAVAEKDAAEARVAEAGARIARLRAELQAAQALEDRRAETVAQMVIVAPFDGVVVAREREVGDVVSPGSTVLEIVDPATLVLSARLDESQMAAMSAGQDAKVTFASEPGQPYHAQVHRIGREVDTETREFTVELALGALPANWAIGQRGAASIVVETRPSTVAIPSETVEKREGVFGAWVLEAGRAAWRPLELGATAAGTVEVLAGLVGGETILSGDRLYAGMRVALPQ